MTACTMDPPYSHSCGIYYCEQEYHSEPNQVHSSWARLCYHYDQHEEEFKDTKETLRENTYIDSLINIGHRLEELKQFKKEATEISEKARFPVHKWESNFPELQSDDMANPGKIL